MINWNHIVLATGTKPVNKIRRKSIATRNETIRWRAFGTDGILLNPSSGDYFEISETGLLIWRHVDGQKTIEEIIENLATHFDITDEDLAKDTIEFMEELINKGLISVDS